MKQPRDSKGKFVSPKKQVFLLQDHYVGVEKLGTHTLEESQKLMKKWGGSYIIQSL